MIRCSGMTHRDSRCKRKVNTKKVIIYPRGASFPFYCHDHLSAGLKNPTFRCLKYPNRVIEYNSKIRSSFSIF